ncbi:hypothetical protein TWF281_002940 [Arthrobotrys megalospora]
MINRHLWFDEETQYPDTMISIVNYCFTDPLVEFVKTATFRLRAENGYWLKLTDTEDEIVDEQLGELKGHLKRKAEEGSELFQFFDRQFEDYGIATLATILLYQLEGLQEIELACSINAVSSRFMLTTMHHFEPPFKLERLGMARLVDFAAGNYQLLNQFLLLGVPNVGIDYRFGSTSGGPKIKPVPDFTSGSDGTQDSSDDDSQDSLEGSMESEYKVSIPYRLRIDNALARTVDQEIEQDYNGYQPLDHRACGYDTGVNYGPLGVHSDPDSEGPLFIEDLRLWLDETPSSNEPLIPLLGKVKGLRHLNVNLFPSVQVLNDMIDPSATDLDCLKKVLGPQTETLETLTIRVSWLGAPQPRIPPLRAFENLRRVHLFYGKDTHENYIAKKKSSGSYFEAMFPPRLELLRVDIFKYYAFLDFVADATTVPTSKFPNLRIVLGISKHRISADKFQATKDIWRSLPYSEDPVSKSWKLGAHITSANPIWRRYDLQHSPIQILAHDSRHRDVFCTEEGWYGPFQEHKAVDMPYCSTRCSSPSPPESPSGASEPGGAGPNAWETVSEISIVTGDNA